MVRSLLSANAEGPEYQSARTICQKYADADFIIIDGVGRLRRRRRRERRQCHDRHGVSQRMNPDAQGEYDSIAVRMNELVRTIPGYVSHKGFVAADGEQVTIVKFESEQALDQWRIHTEHRSAKRRAIETLFSEYKFQICSVLRERGWTASAKPGARE